MATETTNEDIEYRKDRDREMLVRLTDAFAVAAYNQQARKSEAQRFMDGDNPSDQERGRSAAVAAIAAFEQLEKFLGSRYDD